MKIGARGEDALVGALGGLAAGAVICVVVWATLAAVSLATWSYPGASACKVIVVFEAICALWGALAAQ